MTKLIIASLFLASLMGCAASSPFEESAKTAFVPDYCEPKGPCNIGKIPS